MASRRQRRILIGALALALSAPAANAQTPAQPPTQPHSIVRCTEAAPCATPGARKAPGKKPPSAAAIRQFREAHACPTTGHNWGACPGYVVTHITPPCKGGTDALTNLQWQTHTKAEKLDQTACR